MTADERPRLAVGLHVHTALDRPADLVLADETSPRVDDGPGACVARVLLPLLRALDQSDKPMGRFTLSLSSTLLTLLDESWGQDLIESELQARWQRARQQLDDLGSSFHSLADWDERACRQDVLDFAETYGKDLLAVLVGHAEKGRIELVASTGTPTPLALMSSRLFRTLQVAAGCRIFHRRLGRSPRAMWLPQGAYADGVERDLARQGIEYAIVGHDTIRTAAVDRPTPLVTASGVMFLGVSATPISELVGGDGLPLEEAFRRPRADSVGGWSPFRSSREAPLRPYDPQWAADRIAHLAERFASELDSERIVALDVCEVTTHWFEGMDLVLALLREGPAHRTATIAELVGDAAKRAPSDGSLQVASWVPDGFLSGSVTAQQAWKLAALDRVEHWASGWLERSDALSRRGRSALEQAVGELLLARSPGCLGPSSRVGYLEGALGRFRDHLAAAERLLEMLDDQAIDDRHVDVRRRCWPIVSELELLASNPG